MMPSILIPEGRRPEATTAAFSIPLCPAPVWHSPQVTVRSSRRHHPSSASLVFPVLWFPRFVHVLEVSICYLPSSGVRSIAVSFSAPSPTVSVSVAAPPKSRHLFCGPSSPPASFFYMSSSQKPSISFYPPPSGSKPHFHTTPPTIPSPP
jgi:hypothetical protein